MPFSRYQIRNEFSLADPELYKAADKDDPEALLEGVAMAGLVGVLRQLGDLAEFAAEIFHGLHEEVMVTAARGHSLLVRVQQVESDFPAIERAFLSQTGHSAFFSSSGISWHPNLQMEQNLITKGDLPRFVMDSYEECRGPPRLFLLDKFDVAGAGACLKRYTDPSFYKVETSPYEMMNIETQRDKKIRKIKKKTSRWKNGETPEVFQPSHVKLHQLLLEERVQNGASEPTRRVKLKKREIKFPFDTETGKGYMEKLLNSPPEDKLVHEVKMVNSPPRLPTNNSGSPQFRPLEVTMVNSPLASPYESPIVDKTVNREHMDSISSIELQQNDVDSEIEEIEEKHISVNTDHKDDVASDVADDVASEVDNYMDALATMESEVETETEIRPNSDQTLKQFQSQDSDSRSISDDENCLNKKKINNFSYSDTASTSGDDMSSPRGVNSQFASTEIPFRPRVSPHQSFDASLLVEQETNFTENTSKESDFSAISKKKEEIEIDPEDIIDSSSSFVGNLECEVENEEDNSNSTLESNADLEETRILNSSENETELKDEETISVDSESKDSNPAVCDLDDDKITEIKDLIPVSVLDDVVSNESNHPFTCEETESVEKKESSEESVISANYDHSNDVDNLEEESVILPELDSIHSNKQDLENENDVDNQSENLEILQDETVFANEKTDQNVVNEQPNSQFLDNVSDSLMSADLQKSESSKKDDQIDELEEKVDQTVNYESDPDYQESKFLKKDELEEKVDQIVNSESDPDTQESKSLDFMDQDIQEAESSKKDEKIDQLEEKVDQTVVSESDPDFQEFKSLKKDELEEKVDQIVVSESGPDTHESKSLNFMDQDIQEAETLKKDENVDQLEEKIDQTVVSESDPDFQEFKSLKKDELEENVDQNLKSEFDVIDHETDSLPLMADLSQLSNQINLSGFNMLPQLPPINTEEMPPLPPLPPMQWRMGKIPNSNLISNPAGGQPDIDQIPPISPKIDSQTSLNQTENAINDKSLHDSEDLNIKTEEKMEKSEKVSTFGPEIIRPMSTSSLPLIDDEMPNGIRPLKIQRPRTPLIDAVAAHDKSKLRKVSERAIPRVPKEEEKDGLLEQMQLRKVSERAIPTIPKEEERDTLLEQIRAKSFNLKPAVQTRPSIQGPSTNLRVAAILEKANAIRQAFAGSDDDDDGNDSWSDS